jgi:hypothetical protein
LLIASILFGLAAICRRHVDTGAHGEPPARRQAADRAERADASTCTGALSAKAGKPELARPRTPVFDACVDPCEINVRGVIKPSSARTGRSCAHLVGSASLASRRAGRGAAFTGGRAERQPPGELGPWSIRLLSVSVDVRRCGNCEWYDC